MKKFTYIHLQNWRNFTSVSVDLQNRAVLVGPNASGKSNFLDVFRFLSDIVAVGGGFQEAIRRRGGVSKLRSLAARSVTDIVVQVKIADEDAEPNIQWDYEICFNQNFQQPILKREIIKKDGQVISARPDNADSQDTARLTQTYLEQVYANKEFRPIAVFFSSIKYLHIVPQLIRESERSVGRTNDPFGGDFLEQLINTQGTTQKARLRRITKALQGAIPQLKELELYRDEKTGVPHLRGRYEHWRDKGAWLNEDQMSDGTLRLIGLLWAVMDGTGPLLLEEPELSVHPGIARLLGQMLAQLQNPRRNGRQLLISTHSSELLQDEGLGLDETLILIPTKEGTSIQSATDIQEIREQLDAGFTLADIIIPMTKPAGANQMLLFTE